jgi:hypothetical protein
MIQMPDSLLWLNVVLALGVGYTAAKLPDSTWWERLVLGLIAIQLLLQVGTALQPDRLPPGALDLWLVQRVLGMIIPFGVLAMACKPRTEAHRERQQQGGVHA